MTSSRRWVKPITWWEWKRMRMHLKLLSTRMSIYQVSLSVVHNPFKKSGASKKGVFTCAFAPWNSVVYLCIIFVSMHSIFALPGWRHECSLKQMRVSHYIGVPSRAWDEETWVLKKDALRPSNSSSRWNTRWYRETHNYICRWISRRILNIFWILIVTRDICPSLIWSFNFRTN